MYDYNLAANKLYKCPRVLLLCLWLVQRAHRIPSTVGTNGESQSHVRFDSFVRFSVTRVGDLLNFEQVFKAFGTN